MDTSTPATNRLLAGFAGTMFAIPALFFAWYTARLIYVCLSSPADETLVRMRSGMWIGAVTFPLVTAICGYLGWYFLKRAVHGFPQR